MNVLIGISSAPIKKSSPSYCNFEFFWLSIKILRVSPLFVEFWNLTRTRFYHWCFLGFPWPIIFFPINSASFARSIHQHGGGHSFGKNGNEIGTDRDKDATIQGTTRWYGIATLKTHGDDRNSVTTQKS